MAAKKPVEPPKPWEIKPFTAGFAFVADHMLTAHALDNEVREWDLGAGLVINAYRKGRRSKSSIDMIAVRPGFEEFLRRER